MLTRCPECELQVSDKALTCPHCGYPLKQDAKPRPYKSSKSHKRLPNGFGQISELKGRNLRNPYRAMVSIGKKPNGRPDSKVLGFYESYNAAYMALAEYNKSPYSLDDQISLSELYEKWFDKYSKSLKSLSAGRNITNAWSYCKPLYDVKCRDLRAYHIKEIMDTASSPNVKTRIKSLFNLMLDYALEHELVDRNYARTFAISDDIIKEQAKTTNSHMAFSDEEMKILWDNTNINYVDVILIQCYTGFRPQELGLIKLENVDLDKGIIVGGMKTDAGFERVVPINDRIIDFVRNKYDQALELNSKFLLNCIDSRNPEDLRLTYDKYQKRFCKIIDVLDLHPDHRPHDPRKHFVTMAKRAKMDEYAIKRIAGHVISDITEKVYTERTDEWLISEMQKIKE